MPDQAVRRHRRRCLAIQMDERVLAAESRIGCRPVRRAGERDGHVWEEQVQNNDVRPLCRPGRREKQHPLVHDHADVHLALPLYLSTRTPCVYTWPFFLHPSGANATASLLPRTASRRSGVLPSPPSSATSPSARHSSTPSSPRRTTCGLARPSTVRCIRLFPISPLLCFSSGGFIPARERPVVGTASRLPRQLVHTAARQEAV